MQYTIVCVFVCVCVCTKYQLQYENIVYIALSCNNITNCPFIGFKIAENRPGPNDVKLVCKFWKLVLKL